MNTIAADGKTVQTIVYSVVLMRSTRLLFRLVHLIKSTKLQFKQQCCNIGVVNVGP